MIDFETKKVLFIDLDGTLIKTISGKTFPEDITDFRIQLPVLDKIKKKMPNLNWFFVVTNQGGIGRFISKEDFDAKILGITSFCVNYLLCEVGILNIVHLIIAMILLENQIQECQRICAIFGKFKINMKC